MMLEILRAILGLLFVAFIPGYLLCRLIFKDMAIMDRICLSCGLNILIVVLLGFALSLAGMVMGIPMINQAGVWLSLLLVSAVLSVILLGKTATDALWRRGG
jgi:uncharacterized membrane protein